MDSLNLISEQNPALLIKTNFLTNIELDFVMREIKKAKSSFSREGYENKKTIRDHIDPRYCGTQYITNPRNILRTVWDNKFNKEFNETLFEHGDGAFKHASLVMQGPVLLSCYSNTDYYGYHVDIDMGSVTTAVLMLCFNKEFTGGDFLLEDRVIPFEHNKLIVFPSCIPHGVSKISLDSDKYTDMRFSLQYFISATSAKTKLIDESNHIE